MTGWCQAFKRSHVFKKSYLGLCLVSVPIGTRAPKLHNLSISHLLASTHQSPTASVSSQNTLLSDSHPPFLYSPQFKGMIHSRSFPYSAKSQNPKGCVEVSEHNTYNLQPLTLVNIFPAVYTVRQSGSQASKQPLAC